MSNLKKIKKLLLDKDISSLKMAKDIGINPSTLSLYLNGWKAVPEDAQNKIAAYLGVEEKDIFE